MTLLQCYCSTNPFVYNVLKSILMKNYRFVKLLAISGLTLAGILGVIILAFFAFLMSIRGEPLSLQKITPSKSLQDIQPFPGMTSQSALEYFTGNGFICGHSEPFNSAISKISCEKSISEGHIVAWVFSANDDVVYLIDANITQLGIPSDDISIQALRVIAGLPYSGSQPDLAYQWVAITVPKLSGEPGDLKETSFSGMRFRLYGTPNDRSLEIGEIQ